MENKIILLVEDNARDEALALRALKKSNIVNKVLVARDGIEAVDYLFGTGAYEGRDPTDTPQFVLLDLKLPNLDGLEVLRRIRADKRTSRLPVVVFTSSEEDEDLIRSYDLGANSFVRKPVAPERFLEAANQVGLYWLALNQVPKVLIVDAHEVVRDGVKTILSTDPGLAAFGEAGTAPETLKLIREQEWDLAVLDPYLVSSRGMDLLREMKEIRPNLPVLVLTARPGEQFARRAFRAGAAGYITKDSPRSELVKAVKKVMGGGRYLSASIAEEFIFDFDAAGARPLYESLSDREFEVLGLIASGKTVSEIADKLSLSDSTISTYRGRILEKMGMKTNAELTHYAIQNNLVD